MVCVFSSNNVNKPLPLTRYLLLIVDNLKITLRIYVSTEKLFRQAISHWTLFSPTLTGNSV